jgi:alcohol dehydrogenase class IV
MKSFIFEGSPGRVVFGPNAVDDLPREAEQLGARHALVLSTPQQLALGTDLSDRLGNRSVGVYPHAAMHVPLEVAERAIEEATLRRADCVVAAGGGSTIGLAKVIALRSALPILAVPTTYAGSEMTPIYGLTNAGRKTTGRDPRVVPKTVIYDPCLTLDLPKTTSIMSGFNAIAHAAESLYAENANPITNLMAEEGIAALARGLPGVKAASRNLDSRSDCLYGAWLCGAVLGKTNMALHHKLCHVLGGSFSLPHAETHTVILPHVLAYNYAAAPEAMSRIERAMSVANAASAVFQLMRELGAPTSLEELGMKREDLARAASLATESPYYNPRPVTSNDVRALLDDAFIGRSYLPERSEF